MHLLYFRFKKSCTIFDVLLGATFDNTEITPSPPRESIGSTWSSFPLYMYKLSLQRFAIFAICERSPLASFIATIFGIFESSKQVLGSMFTPVLDFTLYTIIGIDTEFATAS